MWKLEEVKVVAMVVSAEGIVSKNFSRNLQNLGLPRNILNVGQRAVVLQTCHIVRKFLNSDQGDRMNFLPHDRAEPH